MVQKAPGAYQTISEVSAQLDVPAHVLRFWESKFTALKPMKRSGGRRYYRGEDIELLQTIKTLLYDEGYTIKGAQNSLKKRSPAQPVPVQAAETKDPAQAASSPASSARLEQAEALLKQAEDRMNRLLSQLNH
jgi:DNA-binding transcriptional MerR regulator